VQKTHNFVRLVKFNQLALEQKKDLQAF
jgi:hypothetical protein